MRCSRYGVRIDRKALGVLLVFQLVFAQVLVAQGVDLEAVPPRQAQDMLKALIPRGKKFAELNAYVAGTKVKDVNLGLSCSSSSSGATSGTVDDDDTACGHLTPFLFWLGASRT